MPRIVWIALVAAACGSSNAPPPGGRPVADPAHTLAVHVDGGLIAGVVEDDVVYFKGIPYAAPPVGDLRWRAPQPVPPWPSIRTAQRYGNDCVQSSIPGDVGSSSGKQSEDCLYLNVWAPHDDSPTRRYPVLVWFHGGGYLNGSAAVPFFDGSQFARDGIIVVTANYRLGRMGFFAHPALTAEGETPTGNYALLDQLAVLKWVRKNIGAVGGDPAQVTVSGQAAGGMSVIHLMSWPAAHGLFQRAVILSGGGRTCIAEQRDLRKPRGTLASAEQSGVDFARGAGVHGSSADALARLRTLDARKVNGSLNISALRTKPKNYVGGPIIDGVIINDQPQTYLRNGHVARVPVIIGTTGADIPAWYRENKQQPYAGFGERERRARDLYEAREFMSRERVASVVSADMNMHEPARFFARQMTAHGVRVWLYRFDYVAQSERPQDKHAPHGSELPFLFNQLDARYGRKTTDQDRASARAFHGYVASFVKAG
ncbi:MAG TPA: carboxylesterase family protein, partial [Longimicrobiales bacterium]